MSVLYKVTGWLGIWMSVVLCSYDGLALPPTEPGDGSPSDPCIKVNTAIVLPHLEVRGHPLVGCSVEIVAGGSKIELVKDTCHDPSLFDLPSSLPISWQLVSWPGATAPDFTSGSTLANLSLPRAGNYLVRFTICPSGNCSFRPPSSTTNYPIGTTSLDLPIVAVASIPIPVEKYPILPASVRGSTVANTHVDDLDCRCGGNGDPWSQQWVTVEPWSGPEDYRFLEGYVEKSWVAVADDLLNHSSNDVGFEVLPDPPFRDLVNTSKVHMDVEWETGSFPERFRPASGDRISVFGFWILDCGHKPNSEIHPPVGIAVHRPRPISIPANEQLAFRFPEGTVTSTAGNNVIVPGVLTELWFNRSPGEITSNCSDTGLHQPARCNPSWPNCAPNCSRYIYDSCIEGKIPMNRVYEFNIYLPRNPAVIAREQGVTAPTPPIYYKISNPWGFGGPEPLVEERVEGDVTYLHVTLNLLSYDADTYSRRIEAAWVYPAVDNWSLKRWQVSFPTLDVHDDQDPWTDGWNADGDYRFWITLNNRDQEWTRVLYGEDNAHGTMNFGPAWRTGSGDSVFWRPFPDTDDLHRMGPDVLSYPDQGVLVSTTAYESDSIWDDDPGRTSRRVLNGGAVSMTSNKGNYTVELQIEPGAPVGNATLSPAATRLNNALRIRCGSNPWTPPIRDLLVNPFELVGYLVPGIADDVPMTVESDVSGARLGGSVAGVGDVNGDGLPDVLVGAPGDGESSNPTGKAQLHLGLPRGVMSAPSWTVSGPVSNSSFGAVVAGLGDVNKDGYKDFVVGAPRFMDGQTNEGAAFVWYGGKGGGNPAEKPDWNTQGNFPGALFGSALAGGDLNGDGFSDLIVGAPTYQNSIAAVVPYGRVFVYYGSANGLSVSATSVLVAPTVGEVRFGNDEWFGASLACADFNADGFSDLVVGAPHLSHGFANEGAVFVYRGTSKGLETTPYLRMEGESFGAQMGYSVAAVGDVNGDGFGDVLVGSPFFFFDDVTFNEGAASLFLGSPEGLRSTAAWGATGRWGGARFGSCVAGIGDINGDGLSDVLVGAPYYSSQANEEGRISVYLGSRGRVVLTGPTWVKSSQLPDAQFGFSAASAGDIDRDGFADFLIGAPGQSHGETHEGAFYLYRGYGTREVRPATTGFFESVDLEPNALFNLKTPGYEKLLIEGAAREPEKFARMIQALSVELERDFLGTRRMPDAIAALAHLRPYVPSDLWDQYFKDLPTVTGGALYLDCGGVNEVLDSVGRRWKPDAPFLVTSNSNRNPFAGQTMDTSLLTDRLIPNEVLLSERWINGNLRYEVPVENGVHTVVLYFAENCPTCVNSNLGGTISCVNCARIFDVEVEGQRSNDYNPSDAAKPPSGDGQGTTFKSTQLVFANVLVSDGVLNIAILDKGNTNPPENSAIDAIAVLQTPLPLAKAPLVMKGIRKVERNWEIRVDPGLGYASYLSGLVKYKLERSKDLVSWVATSATPFVLKGELIFEVAPEGDMGFFRVQMDP